MAKFKITFEGTTSDVAQFMKSAKSATDALSARLANEGGHVVDRVAITPVDEEPKKADDAPASPPADPPQAAAPATKESTKKG